MGVDRRSSSVWFIERKMLGGRVLERDVDFVFSVFGYLVFIRIFGL